MYVVAGGGLAGLVAAARIVEAGHSVRVFEPSNAIGGCARTHRTDGEPVERVPGYVHSLDSTAVGSVESDDQNTGAAGSEPTSGVVCEVAETVGVADRLVQSRGRTARYLDGVVHPVDAPWERLAYPGLGLRNTLRLRRLRRLHEGDVDETVESIVTDRTGRDLYTGWFEPRLRATFGNRASDVPATWLADHAEREADRDRRGLAVSRFDGSMAVLVEALVETIGDDAIRRNARIVDVDAAGRDRSANAVVTVSDGSGTRRVACDGVVVATNPADLERLVEIDTEVETRRRSHALVTVSESVTDVWRLTVDDTSDIPFGVVYEHTNLVSPERYGGEHLLYLVGRPDTEPASETLVRDRWLDALADRFPAFTRETVRSVRVTADQNGVVLPTAEGAGAGASAVSEPPSWPLPVDLEVRNGPRVAYAGPGSERDEFGTHPASRIAAGVAAASVLTRSASPEPAEWSWGPTATN